MATATFGGFAFVDNAVFANIVYDTNTFVVQSVQYQNTTALPAAVVIVGPLGFAQTLTLAAHSAFTSTDVSGLAIVMSHQSGTDKNGHPVIFVNYPAGWSISARYPA